MSHNLLIKKLGSFNINVNGIKLISSYLAGRFQYVSYGGQDSHRLPINHGVPQGSVLGPLLFLIFINDLPRSIPRDANMILFADDTAITVSSNDVDTLHDRMKDSHVAISNWFGNNRLSLNESKTQVLVFSLRRIQADLVPVKYLGVHLDSGLTWEVHVSHLMKKLNSAIFAIRSLRGLVPLDVLMTTYYGCFFSHATYMLLCWGHSAHTARVFGAQRRCVRVMANLGYRACCKTTFKELKILTIPCIYIFHCLVYIKSNISQYKTVNSVHNHDTRSGSRLRLNYTRTARARDSINYFGIKFYNVLPDYVGLLNIKDFKLKVKNYLTIKAFYSVTEYLNNNFDDM